MIHIPTMDNTTIKYFLFTIALSLLPLMAFSQEIVSIETMPLRWSHFTKKETAANSVMKAMTVANIKMEMSTEEDKTKIQLTIKLKLQHDEQASWVSKGFLRRSRDEATTSLLYHERIHLAINYLGMYQMYQALERATYTTDYKAEVTKIFREMNFTTEMRQIQYDSETMHSVRAEEQEQWHKLINEELRNSFASFDDMKKSYTITKTIYK